MIGMKNYFSYLNNPDMLSSTVEASSLVTSSTTALTIASNLVANGAINDIIVN